MADHQYSIKDGKGSPIFFDQFGGGDYLITVGGRVIQFDWSDRFGPLPTNRRTGQSLDLGPRHAFWRAASLWNLQGQRLEGRNAIWHEPKKPVLKHLGGNHYKVIEHGEKGHDW